MNFAQAIKAGGNNFFNPRGRASRSEYWWWMLFLWVIGGVLGVIGGFVAGNGGVEQTWVGIVFEIFPLVAAISVVCATIRRLHDTNRSGWNTLWYFLPFIGWIIVVVFCCQPSYPGPDKYGDVPA